MSQSLEAGTQPLHLCESDSARAASRRSPADASSAPGEKRVLIVDDDQNILSSLRRLFRREDYEVVTASGAEEALRLMEETPVHVVISDYRMPGMTGTDLLREVQRLWPDTVRVVLSGYSEVNAIIDAINEGAIYKFVSKPWNDEEILLSVRRAVEQYELTLENKRMAQQIAQQNEQLRELNRSLDQRAADASFGQTVAQELLEDIDVGLLVVDPSGLIVMANRKVWDILQLGEGPLVGLPAPQVLPCYLNEVLSRTGSSDGVNPSGRLEVKGRKVEWRLRVVGGDGNHRGTIITLWAGVL